MEIIITEVQMETPVRRLRVAIVWFFSKLLHVPIQISDEFYGASIGTSDSESSDR